MRPRLPLLLVLLGVSFVLGGFFYDLTFAGIPDQDPTPEMSARYAHHAQVASRLMLTGLGMVVLGILISIARRTRRRLAARRA